jgi:hypothetical protein
LEFTFDELTAAETQHLGLTKEVENLGAPIEAAVNHERTIFLLYRGSPMPGVRDYMDMTLVWQDGRKIGLSCFWGDDRVIEGKKYDEMKIHEILIPPELEPFRAEIFKVLEKAIFVLMGLDKTRHTLFLTDSSKEA